ncbi:MAG: YqcC family protein [Ketobacteraceae bacterium]|nr:YqcC family protein [Ketobacteraceae bacterium]
MSTLLIEIETEMKDQALWSQEPPARSAFASTVPFYADTMAFTDWLQWVFVVRFRELLEGGHPLPDKSAVHPMAEEMFRDLSQETDALLNLIAAFDRELSGD